MITVKPYTKHCGVVIENIDLGSLSESEMNTIRHTFIEHGLVFFRNQNITPKQHISFAEQFGNIIINKIFKGLPEHPEIAVISKDKNQKTNIGGGWHTDHSYDNTPAKASIVVARKLPKKGGATRFANMYAAYDGLSDGLKRILKQLTGIHSNEHLYGKDGYFSKTDLSKQLSESLSVNQAKHPLIIKHPESHKSVLYVNKAHTIGIENWTTEEAFSVLNYLYEHGIKKDYTCEFDWQPGSIAMWDNRSTWHYANNDYQGEERVLHRITVEGSELYGIGH